MKKVFLFSVLLLLATCKLYQVTSLFRHGARFHLGDKIDGNTTRDEWGEITKVGMRQHQRLGQIIRKQYIDNLHFLSQTYKKSEIEAFATSVNRTIQSAQSQIYGLYPPGNGPKLIYTKKKYHLPPYSNTSDIEEQNFAFPKGFQHIQVTADRKDSIFLENCPLLSDLCEQNYKNHSLQTAEMNMTYYPLMIKMVKAYNLTNNFTFSDIYSDFGNIMVDKYLGRPLAEGLDEEDFKNLEHIHTYIMAMKFGDSVARLKSTNILKKILSEFDNRIKNPNGYALKWSFLSAHDTDVLPTLIALNMSSFECIEQLYRKGSTSALNCRPTSGFASSIILELHSDNEKDFYVMVRAEGQYMYLCEQKNTKCDYGEFKKRLTQHLIPNTKKMCGITKETKFDENFDPDFEWI